MIYHSQNHVLTCASTCLQLLALIGIVVAVMQKTIVPVRRRVLAQDSDLAAVVSNAAWDIGSFIRTQRAKPPRSRCVNWPSGPG